MATFTPKPDHLAPALTPPQELAILAPAAPRAPPARPGIGVVVHSHPLYATVWANLGEVPPVMDQSSAPIGLARMGWIRAPIQLGL